MIDLTRPLDATMPIFRDGDYADPPLEIAPWCGIAERGFRVARLAMGTQTGTHIDAPAHFSPGGSTLERLDPAALVGRYFHVDLAAISAPGARAARLAEHGGERILFVVAPEAPVAEAVLDELLALAAPVWVVAGEIAVADRPAFHANRRLAEAGIYLVEDLEPLAAARVPVRGCIIALPLRLEGVSGSPCRVLVLPD